VREAWVREAWVRETWLIVTEFIPDYCRE